ncbi:CC/Se motif family (seleno)protein [Clostridiaceae bacterium 35-E11]
MHAAIPHVRVKEPEAPEQYDRFEVDEITVYVYKGAVVKNVLRLSLANYVFFKQIEVNGIKVI